MGRFSATLNRYVRGDTLTPAASAARTATGDSGWLNCEEYSTMALVLDVTVVGADADETLDVVVQTASDSSGTGAAAVTGSPFTQRTQPGGVTSQRKTLSGFDQFYRVGWTLAGTTPTFTFSVSGDAK